MTAKVRTAPAFIAGALSFALVAACPVAALAEPAETYETVVGVAGAILTSNAQEVEEEKEEVELPAALKGDTKIEKLTIACDNATEVLREAEDKIARIQTEIDELEVILPKQQERSDASIKQRYIMQSNPLAIAEPLLTSQSLDDFIQQVDYLQLISKANLDEVNKTREMKSKLDTAREKQARIRDDAQAEVDEAEAALEAAQDARAERQKDGQSKAVKQASSESEKQQSAKKSKKKSESTEEPTENATVKTGALVDGADWYAHRDDFIAKWAKRLDKYLEGTPLEGQGVNFAASAWKYNIDPRWSAAISNTESSKGAYCIRPHNAWGWGAADSDPYGLASEWDSWEEAIDAHAAGLSKGYGYTISIRGAQSYCPPSWQSWYNKTLSEMAKI